MPEDDRVGIETEATAEARRNLEVCNSCRYCEGYCAVFPAMALRREFSTGDLTHLANLCHGCKGCYHSCQYAPPHEFGINLPATFAQIRQESYEDYAWPRPLGSAFRRSGTVLSLAAALGVALVLILTAILRDPAVLHGVQTGPGAFYRIIPWGVMVTLAGISFVYALIAMGISAGRYIQGTEAKPGRLTAPDASEAAMDVLTLRYLGGGGHGCNDVDESFSKARRHFHQSLFYGFLLCFAATCVATLYDHFLKLEAPYAFLSLPVQLGFWGGLLLCLGAVGLTWIKMVTDPAPVARHLLGGDYALLALLFLIGGTGLLLLAARDSAAMGVLLAIHFGLVLSLFVTLPYSKMVHGLYRTIALLRNAREIKFNYVK